MVFPEKCADFFFFCERHLNRELFKLHLRSIYLHFIESADVRRFFLPFITHSLKLSAFLCEKPLVPIIVDNTV